MTSTGPTRVFDAEDSPLTQTFGLGLFAPATPALMSNIEAFFEQRGAAVMHEVSPLAGVDILGLLVDRGYRPIEMSTVLVQGLEAPGDASASPSLHVRRIEPADRDAWVDTSVAGWSDDPSRLRHRGVTSPVPPPGGSMTLGMFEDLVRMDLLALANIRTTAEERTSILTVPATFGPPCPDHDTLESNAPVFDADVEQAGVPYTMFDVFANWRSGGVTGPTQVVWAAPDPFYCP